MYLLFISFATVVFYLITRFTFKGKGQKFFRRLTGYLAVTTLVVAGVGIYSGYQSNALIKKSQTQALSNEEVVRLNSLSFSDNLFCKFSEEDYEVEEYDYKIEVLETSPASSKQTCVTLNYNLYSYANERNLGEKLKEVKDFLNTDDSQITFGYGNDKNITLIRVISLK